MQLTYIFSELSTGLRRNVSMTVAVIVTLTVSLTLVGLGLLLQPVMHSRPTTLHKSLVLPLPADDVGRFAAAAFWLALVAPFVRRTGYDLVLFVTRVDLSGKRSIAIPRLGWTTEPAEAA